MVGDCTCTPYCRYSYIQAHTLIQIRAPPIRYTHAPCPLHTDTMLYIDTLHALCKHNSCSVRTSRGRKSWEIAIKWVRYTIYSVFRLTSLQPGMVTGLRISHCALPSSSPRPPLMSIKMWTVFPIMHTSVIPPLSWPIAATAFSPLESTLIAKYPPPSCPPIAPPPLGPVGTALPNHFLCRCSPGRDPRT